MAAPKLPSFFKSNGPRQFNYKPWFYNPEKEAREKRNRMLIAELEQNTSEKKEEVSLGLHEKWRQSHSGLQQRTKSNFRLLIILMLLLLAVYYLLH